MTKTLKEKIRNEMLTELIKEERELRDEIRMELKGFPLRDPFDSMTEMERIVYIESQILKGRV